MTVKDVLKMNYGDFEYGLDRLKVFTPFDVIIYANENRGSEKTRWVIFDEIVTWVDLYSSYFKRSCGKYLKMKAVDVKVVPMEKWYGRYCIQIDVDLEKERKREKYEKRFNKKRA